jgi:hypothetical protein
MDRQTETKTDKRRKYADRERKTDGYTDRKRYGQADIK